jgi:uncharacterized protein YcfJ
MKHTALSLAALATLGLYTSSAQADEMGRVISSTPVIQQVAVPRQVCTNQPVAVPQQKSGAGAVMGALAGGAMGNAVGDGGGRAAATILGIVGGALLGDRIEGAPGSQVQNVQQCSTQTFYENRTVAYNVVYEYAGKQYSVQMPNDPGQYVRLQITPVGTSQALPEQAAPLAAMPVQPAAQTIYVQPATVVQTGVVALPYYYRPYYPPVGVSLNLGYARGHYHHGPRYHWR